ncbi:MAG TPA: orotate phosphoribosyltransferase [Nitrospiria bacterium]|nr:orotate phosphoribosyltransferase [Nitrospiria bacterium]
MPARKQPRPKKRSSDARKLLHLLYRNSFRHENTPTFKLASGRTSRYYIDCKKVTLDPEGATLIGRLIFDRIKSLRPQGIGGLTLGADPIALAVAMTSHAKGQPIPAFIIRKEPKGHGTAAWIEGSLAKGSGVVVVEDVVTTGESAKKAIERLKAHQCVILSVVALVDRLEGGGENLKAEGYSLDALFTVDDLLSVAGLSRDPSEAP